MLRRLLESRMDRRGKREFVQVLRLMEIQGRGGARGCARRPQTGHHKLRRGQAPGAVQDRGTAAEARPGTVPPPAQGERDNDIGRRLHGADAGGLAVSGKATVLLEHRLRELKLPTFLREYGKMAGQCAAEGVDHPGYLLRLSELELIERHHRMVDRRIKAARCEYVDRRENVIAEGNSGTGKTHVALGLGLAACQR